MNDLFSVDNYRQYLETFYRNAYDENTVFERKRAIDKLSDEYLQSIIDNTKEFIIFVIKKI